MESLFSLIIGIIIFVRIIGIGSNITKIRKLLFIKENHLNKFKKHEFFGETDSAREELKNEFWKRVNEISSSYNTPDLRLSHYVALKGAFSENFEKYNLVFPDWDGEKI